MRGLSVRIVAMLLFGMIPVTAFQFTAGAEDVSCHVHAPLNPDACPATLRVPALDLSTPLTAFPVADGTWEISLWEAQVGHFQYTDWFGNGNTVLGGHATYPGDVPAIFYDLDTLEPGNLIFVDLPDHTLIYIVQRVYVTNYRDLSPIHSTEHGRLTLITCDTPSFDPETGTYADRVVVQAVRLR
jgi:LPXTG-site transpeptidase (sortase) family protein